MKDERPLKINTSVLVSYAQGILAPEIALKVEKALAENEALRWEYEGILQLMKDYPDEDPEELLEQMAERIQQRTAASLPDTTDGKKPKPAFRNWLLIAAIFLVLATMSIFFVVHKDQNSYRRLAMEMLTTATISPYSNETRGDIHRDDTVAAWKESFISNDFSSVIALLKNKREISSEEKFFLAMAYLKISPPQPDNAEVLLKQVITSGSNFSSDAWLYAGLAQALQNKKKEAAESLSHVEQTAQIKNLLGRLRQ